MRALLDVNVLIALFDPDHVHHARAWRWFERQAANGWASCPITQNGCVRVMSQPGYPNPLPIAAIVQRLTRATSSPEHEFWPDDLSLLDTRRFDHSRVVGHRQLTDLYLLALAATHEACLATFDGAVPLSAAREAGPRYLVVV
jgi:hypothetical protein